MARPSEIDVARVMIEALPDDMRPARLLVANDLTGTIAADIVKRGSKVVPWRRRAGPEGTAMAWPPAGPFDGAIVRLPKARAELEMTLHAVASVVSPSGTIWLYGANDEGIKSAQKPMGALFGEVLTVETRGHCRVLSAVRPVVVPGLKPRLADWAQFVEIDVGAGPRRFVTYPGCFALGRLDAGTKLLLEHLPHFMPDARVLDFGSGMGVIAATLRLREPGSRLTLLDNDAVALAAARENVPDATYATALSQVAAGSLDAILSNPPIHEGKAEDHGALTALVNAAPKLLRRGGSLQIVVQRRVGASEAMRAAFGACDVIAEDGVFQVLRAMKV